MAEQGPSSQLVPEHLQGRRLEAPQLPFDGSVLNHAEGATWRGWLLGLFAVALISLVIPYFDFVIRGTMLSNNMFPATSVMLLFALVACVSLLARVLQARLRLTRQDLVLIFAMTMVVNAIPGCGFWTFWVAQVSGGFQYQTPENRFAELVLPHVPASWSPRDGAEVRPLEWFYTGLPPGREIPWTPWVAPYALWCGALLMMFGMIFALCALLRRQWSEHEQLAFPLAQLPEDMLAGLNGGGQQPFFKDRMALTGILAVFAFHSWNSLSEYYDFIPRIKQGESLYAYLTEPPLNGLNPVSCFIYPSVIGLTFLISLEVSFSLWFFFIVSRVTAMLSIQAGILSPARSYWSGPFVDIGTGALVALAVGTLYTARREFSGSFLEALGVVKREPEPGELGPRFWWLLLTGCFMGSVAWMMCSGISLPYAVLILLAILVVMTGMTRLSAEGGLFFMQMYVFPVHFLGMVATPAVMGPEQFVRLTIWDRVMVADWYRVLFMPGVMNSMHLAGKTSLRRRTLVSGLAVAVVLALGVSFFSHLYTAYTYPGGASQLVWYYNSFPREQYANMANTVSQLQSFEDKQVEAAAAGREVPVSDTPQAARRDWTQIGWVATGSGMLAATMAIRKFVFWFPHPIGFVMWMGPYPLVCLWFSFFLGWAIKFCIIKYGGGRVYLSAKRLFIGLVVGEALATIFWKLIAVAQYHTTGASILPG